MSGLIGKKLGMTSVFDDAGNNQICTVIELGPNVVTQIRTLETDGYSAVQVTFGERRETTLTQPVSGHYAKAGVAPGRKLVELRLDDVSGLEVGQTVGVDTFEPGEKVDIRLDVITPGNKLVEEYDSASGGVIRRAFTAQDAEEGRRFIYDDTRRVQYSVGPKKTENIAEVVKSLIAYRKADPEKKATIDPRTGVTNSDVVIVLDAAIDAGYSDITFKGSFER